MDGAAAEDVRADDSGTEQHVQPEGDQARRPRRGVAALVGAVALAGIVAAGAVGLGSAPPEPAAERARTPPVPVAAVLPTGLPVAPGSTLPGVLAVPVAPAPAPSPGSVGALARARPVPPTRHTACPPPRCSDVSVPLPAGVRVPDNRVRVLLPRGYAGTTRRYPVVYLLHGRGGTYEEWTTRSDLTAYTAGTPAIFVMPDGGRNATAGWYSDWEDGTFQVETFHVDVLMPWVASHYRTLPGRNAVMGLSMGGLGALTYAAHHPGAFRVAASFSGVVDSRYAAPATRLLSGHMARVWGDRVADAGVWAAHDPTALAPALVGTTVLLASGTGDAAAPPARPGGQERALYSQHPALLAALDRSGVVHRDHFYAGGTHSWPYWTADLHWALPQVLAALR